jgi:hypothetical protein
MSKRAWATAVSLASILALAATGWAGTHRQQKSAPASRNASANTSFYRKPFTADMTLTTANGKTHSGKAWFGHQAMRMDVEIQPGMESDVIIRFDKKVIWVLMPGRHAYLEMPATFRAGMLASVLDKDAKTEKQDLGPEKVGQYECEKYRVHATSHGQETNGFVWVASRGKVKGYIVRTEQEKTGAVAEFSNIQPGEPAASLFEVPAGYRKIQAPAMSGMPHE